MAFTKHILDLWEKYFIKVRYIIEYPDVTGLSKAVNNVMVYKLSDSTLPLIEDTQLAAYLKLRKNSLSWVLFIYKEHNKVLGYSFLHVPLGEEEWNDSLPTTHGEARISSNFVSPKYRGKGIRGKLFEAQYEYATKRNLKMWCVIERKNKSSVNAELKYGVMAKQNLLVKIFGVNIFSILSPPLKAYFLIGRKRQRR